MSTEYIVNEKVIDSHDEFLKACEEMQKAQATYELTIQKELNVSARCASDISYLRSRSRWTQELEDTLVKMDREGKHPENIFEFGSTPETKKALMDIVDASLKEKQK